MELDSIKQIIQDFFQENTLTVVGSGLSAAEGIPGMSALSNELQSKIPQVLSDSIDIKLWDKINKDLLAGVGLEQALHNTKPSPYIEENIRTITANFIGNAEKKVLYDIINGKKILRFADYLDRLKDDDTRKGVNSAGKQVKGDWEGKLTRFIARLESKLEDKTYGFMFQPSPESQNYGWLSEMLCKLLEQTQKIE